MTETAQSRSHFGPRRARRRTPPGASPGTLVADPQAETPVLRVLAYGPDGVEERQLGNPSEVKGYLEQWPVVWISVEGLGDPGLIEALGRELGLHKLALEDVLDVHQRPKAESYAETLFILTRFVAPDRIVRTEQLALFVGRNFVASFQESSGVALEPVRNRIRRASGQIRGLGADYLTYAIMDAAIDCYFPVLEHLGDRLEILEAEVIEQARDRNVHALHALKRDLLALRRALWPMREMTNGLIRDHSAPFGDTTLVFLRDCYDHTVQLLDMIDTHREMVSAVMDLQVSQLSARMNEVMKVLTIIATIFIPLSFVSGVYGMNFDTEASPWNMPELDWAFGYPAVLGFMGALAIGMLGYFVRKGWIGRR